MNDKQAYAAVLIAFATGTGTGYSVGEAEVAVTERVVDRVEYKTDEDPQTAMRTLCRYANRKVTTNPDILREECDRGAYYLENQAKYLIGAVGPSQGRCDTLPKDSKPFFDCKRAEIQERRAALNSIEASRIEKLRLDALAGQQGRCADEWARRRELNAKLSKQELEDGKGLPPPTPEECSRL